MAQRVTIHDVARAAGVSAGTVSNAINHPDRVAGSTRERVHAAVDRLGYAPAVAARQLRTGRSETVGVVVPDLSNSFWAEVAAGVEAAATRRGRRLIVSATQGVDRTRERTAIETHAESGVDGLLLASFLPPKIVTSYLDLSLPLVLLGRQGQRLGISSVSVDETSAMRQTLEHLRNLGHERIVFVNGSSSSWSMERRHGWRRAVRQQGLHPAATFGEIVVQDVMLGAGDPAVAQLLAMRPTPTAVVCANDYMAVDIMHALARNRLRVPDDITVVGFDDNALARLVTPALTTVRQDPTRLGAEAFGLLHDGAADEHVWIEPNLIVRDSSGPPPRDRSSTRHISRPTNDAPATIRPLDGTLARDTLQDVIAAAFAIVDEDGIEAVTYRAIAQRVGISLGTLSYHLRPFGDLRNHLWQEVEVRIAGSVVGATDAETAAARMLDWTARHRRRAEFYVTHSPDPQRPLRLDLLSSLPNVVNDPDILEQQRPFLRYVGRRLQAAVEYAISEPDLGAARAALAAELGEQHTLWQRLVARLTNASRPD